MTAWTQHYLDEIDPLVSRFIRGKVRQLIRYPGFSAEDREDLCHDFVINLIRRQAQFNPSVGTWEAFVIVVCENHFANLIEHRSAKKRSRRKEAGSLNNPVQHDGGTQSFGDTLPDTQRTAHTGRSPRPTVTSTELRVDVATVLDKLPPNLRDLCERLKSHTVSEIVRTTGVHRSQVYDSIRKIRQQFEDAGLQEYL